MAQQNEDPKHEEPKSNALAHDEKITAVAIYTMTGLAIGKLITKEQVRVSTWLRTDMAPGYLSLHQARFLSLAGTATGRAMTFSKLHVPSSQVIAFHVLPPSSDPLDYDPDEPHRKMEPVTVLIGFFRVGGFARMSTYSNVGKYLEATKETFLPIYQVEISNLAIPSLDVVRVPYALVRQDAALFAIGS
jgi:hypothetical protein